MINARSWPIRTLPVLVGVFVGACSQTEEPRTIALFADRSCSVTDATPYRDAFRQIVAGLEPGDRVTLGRIAAVDTPYATPVDRTIPTFSILSDNRRRYRTQILPAAVEQLSKDFEQILAGPCSQNTPILDTISLAGKVLGDEGRRRVLVILSDMLEDSDDYDFLHLRLSEEALERVIRTRAAAHALPDLGGVTVYVAGAHAPTARKRREIERFWTAYFAATGATLNSRHYGPSLIGFETPEPGPRAPGRSSRATEVIAKAAP
jgi:hypothetical protein